MTATYSYNRGFRLKLIALCVDPVWAVRVGSLIEPHYFDNEHELEVVRAIVTYRTAYKRPPNDPDDILALIDPSEDDIRLYEDLIYDVFEAADEQDLSLAGDIAVQWAREQAAKIAILDSVDDVKRGRLASVYSRIKAVADIGQNLTHGEIDFHKDVHSWIHEAWLDKVRTGWLHIDEYLDGGLGNGEMGIILSPTNKGKSMTLVNTIVGAAGFPSVKDVGVFTHEMKPTVYAKRIGARIVFRFPKRGDDLEEYEAEVNYASRLLLPGKIRIVGGPRKMTTTQIEDHTDRWKQEGFKFGLLVDDYIDLIIPPARRTDKRFELSDLAEWFRGLCGHWDVPGWTASQVTRASYTKEIITMSDIAEDIGKANIADVIIALCQTPDENKKDRCRLFMAKVRDGARAGAMFDAKYYPLSQAVITTGLSVRREEETDV
jgi:hypothetical protein